MGMILRIASSRIVGQGDIVGRSGYFSLNLSANSVMRGRLDARRTLKSLVADLRYRYYSPTFNTKHNKSTERKQSFEMLTLIYPKVSPEIKPCGKCKCVITRIRHRLHR